MTQPISALDFDAAAYWAKVEYKKWVVTLESGPHRKPKRETRYVSAKTSERAIKCATDDSFMKSPRIAGCRLATPQDLGATRAPEGFFKPRVGQWNR